MSRPKKKKMEGTVLRKVAELVKSCLLENSQNATDRITEFVQSLCDLTVLNPDLTNPKSDCQNIICF